VFQRMIEFSMYLASSYGREQVLKLLLDAIPASSPMLAFEDFWRETCLIKAAKFGHTSIATLLLDKGADVDLARGFSKTPLYHASRNNHIDMVRLLIERGATIDKSDNQGRTPLFRAFRYGYAATAKLLLQHGADLHLKDGFGINPIHIAVFGEGSENPDMEYDTKAMGDLIRQFSRSGDWLLEDWSDRFCEQGMRCTAFGTYEPGSPGLGLRNSGIDDYIKPIGI
jgi:Ankyrin repeats (3 copies)